MKQVIGAFALGALMAGGVAYVSSQRQAPSPGPVAAAPAAPAPAPTAEPVAPAPQAASEAEPERPRPVKPEKAADVRKREPKQREPKSEPVIVARVEPAPVKPVDPPAVKPEPTPAPAPVPAPEPPPPVVKADPPKAPVALSPPPGTRTEEPKRMPRESQTVTIAEGTMIGVRLLERVASDIQQPGDTFAASLSEPLVIDGFVIAEKDARCEGRVVDAKKAGRVRGTAALSIELTRITLSDGQKITVQTSPFDKAGPDTSKQDAAKVGVGAAIGAAIGAIAGGGKGAGIGAAAGGAAGGGTVIAGRGKPAELPTETRVSFRLTAPVTVTEKARR